MSTVTYQNAIHGGNYYVNCRRLVADGSGNIVADSDDLIALAEFGITPSAPVTPDQKPRGSGSQISPANS